MWQQDESGRVHTPLEPIVLAATLALIPVLILEADAEGRWQTAAFVANWFIWGVFTETEAKPRTQLARSPVKARPLTRAAPVTLGSLRQRGRTEGER